MWNKRKGAGVDFSHWCMVTDIGGNWVVVIEFQQDQIFLFRLLNLRISVLGKSIF